MSNASKSLIGKVVKHNLHAFLVMEDLDEEYVGFWASGNKAEPGEIPKVQLEGEPPILANSMSDYIAMRTKQEINRAGKAKYLNKVCLNANSTLGIVTSYEDGVCHGVTFQGGDWHAQYPVIQADSLADYYNKKVREQLGKI